jgi:hypothetical protein
MSLDNDLVIQQLRKHDPEVSNHLRDIMFGDKVEKRAKWEALLK